MNIDELKKLIKNSTSVLVLDNGEPSFVVMNYKTYQEVAKEPGAEKEIKINQANGQITNNQASGLLHDHEQETEILEKLNKEILALKAQIEAEEKILSNQHID